MKRKFFWTIFGVLAITMLAVSAIYTFFIRIERLHLIDERIEIVASNILASGLEQEDVDAMSELISMTLDEEPTLSFVTLYSRHGRILFRNQAAKTVLGNAPIDIYPQRLVKDFGDRSIRVINFPVSVAGTTLQVGATADSDFLHWRTLNFVIIRYLIVIFLLGLLVATYLSRRLLHPLRSLTSYLSHVTGQIGSDSAGGELPFVLDRELQNGDDNDEFSELINTSRSLTEKLSSRFQLSQRTAAQMAHELKTPLTIIRNMVESEQSKEKQLAEIDRLTQLIQSFLTWSRFAFGLQNESPLHAVKVQILVESLVARFSTAFPNRIEFHNDLNDEFRLFCDPDLLDQALSNLVDNALKYSPSASPVTVLADRTGFEVRDQGPGISSGVEKRIGEPFNFGVESRASAAESFGLGLAWVDSIAKAYGWKLVFNRAANYFSAKILWTADEKRKIP